MERSKGFSVRIFIPTGEPEGLRIVEKSNWTGRGLVFPRARYAEVRKRGELGRTGVYILWGPGESGRLPKVYVGEGDGVLPRLDRHAREKDFWTHAAVFTSKDENLNKAHVQYLEARLVELAARAKRAELDNGNAPQRPGLSEADAADAEGFLEDLLLCLPVVGVNLFEQAGGEAVDRSRELFLKARGIEARGFDGSEGFVVRAGSRAARAISEYCPPNLLELRRLLEEQGLLVSEGGDLRLTQDYTFNSPSTAAGVLLGRSSNGRVEWKDGQGRTLREIQEAETAGGASESGEAVEGTGI